VGSESALRVVTRQLCTLSAAWRPGRARIGHGVAGQRNARVCGRRRRPAGELVRRRGHYHLNWIVPLVGCSIAPRGWVEGRATIAARRRRTTRLRACGGGATGRELARLDTVAGSRALRGARWDAHCHGVAGHDGARVGGGDGGELAGWRSQRLRSKRAMEPASAWCGPHNHGVGRQDPRQASVLQAQALVNATKAA
jgi:hypothetical protein